MFTMPAVRTDDSGEHEHGYRRRERGRKRKRSFPLFRAGGRDLPPWVRLVTRRRVARSGRALAARSGPPMRRTGGGYYPPGRSSTPKCASGLRWRLHGWKAVWGPVVKDFGEAKDSRHYCKAAEYDPHSLVHYQPLARLASWLQEGPRPQNGSLRQPTKSADNPMAAPCLSGSS
jgi:hypothetical protein